jgi:hypothetical protein
MSKDCENGHDLVFISKNRLSTLPPIQKTMEESYKSENLTSRKEKSDADLKCFSDLGMEFVKNYVFRRIVKTDAGNSLYLSATIPFYSFCSRCCKAATSLGLVSITRQESAVHAEATDESYRISDQGTSKFFIIPTYNHSGKEVYLDAKTLQCIVADAILKNTVFFDNVEMISYPRACNLLSKMKNRRILSNAVSKLFFIGSKSFHVGPQSLKTPYPYAVLVEYHNIEIVKQLLTESMRLSQSAEIPSESDGDDVLKKYEFVKRVCFNYGSIPISLPPITHTPQQSVPIPSIISSVPVPSVPVPSALVPSALVPSHI